MSKFQILIFEFLFLCSTHFILIRYEKTRTISKFTYWSVNNINSWRNFFDNYDQLKYDLFDKIKNVILPNSLSSWWVTTTLKTSTSRCSNTVSAIEKSYHKENFLFESPQNIYTIDISDFVIRCNVYTYPLSLSLSAQYPHRCDVLFISRYFYRIISGWNILCLIIDVYFLTVDVLRTCYLLSILTIRQINKRSLSKKEQSFVYYLLHPIAAVSLPDVKEKIGVDCLCFVVCPYFLRDVDEANDRKIFPTYFFSHQRLLILRWRHIKQSMHDQ